MKRILIFGAGINQITLIEACNKLGFDSIVIDPAENPPGKQIARYFFQVDANDYQATYKIAMDWKISGIATSQMENPLKMMARLAKELCLIFNSPEVIEQSTNKYLMKQVFLKNNIPCAKGRLFINPSEILQADLCGFEFPLIIKPVDAFSSRGVFRVENIKEINKHLPETLSFSKSKKILVEEFIGGKELSIEAVTFKKETTIVQYTDKIITPFPNVVELGHIQPAEISQIEKKQIDEVVTKTISSLGIDNTVTHTELKLSKNGPVIIEIGPRMGGDFISTYLTKSSCGVDLDTATIQMCVGIKPCLKPTVNNFSFVNYIQLPAGKKIQKIENLPLFNMAPDLVFYHLFVKKGDTTLPVKHSGNRSGVIITTACNKDELLKKNKKYTDLLINSIKLSN